MAQRGQQRRTALWLVVGAICLGILLVAATYLFVHAQEMRLRQDVEGRLAAVAGAQAGGVAGWREARLAEATAVFEDLPLARRVQCFVANRDDAEARKDIVAALASLSGSRPYRGAFLLDGQGALLLGGAEGNEPLGEAAQGLAGEAMHARQVVTSDLYREPTSGEPRLDLAAPILDPCTRAAAPLGAIVLRADPRPSLDALLGPPPDGWSSVEGILLRQEQGGLRVLNDLRGQPASALAVLLPRDDGRLPAGLVAAQAGGVVEGPGLYGAPVLATLRIIPASPWYLAVQVDAHEALAPLRERARFLEAGALLLLLALVLVLALGALAGRQATLHRRARKEADGEQARLHAELAIRRSEVEGLKTTAAQQAAELAALEDERKALQEAIRRHEKGEAASRRESDADATILAMAGVPVMVLDGQGRIVRFNWACERLTGRLFHEVMGRPPWEALAPAEEREAARADFASLVAGEGTLRRERLWLARDGRTIRINWAMNAVSGADGKPQYVIAIGLRVTERRQPKPKKKP